ncbi:hypothetical protein MMC22_005334 [Lobaria immixta]|nr:hypothetical protein [Lobaria immixta]
MSGLSQKSSIDAETPPPYRLHEPDHGQRSSSRNVKLAVARERVRSLEEQLEEAKNRIEAERARGERAVAEERNRGEQALANERKWGRDQIRAMLDRGVLSASNENRGWRTFSRRNQSV